MFFPITTVALLACLLGAHRKSGGRSPLFLALCVWGFGVLLMSAPIFVYNVGYSIRTDAFVAGCLLATTVGYLAFRAKPREVAATYWNRPRELRVAKVLGVAGIIGCLVLLLSAGVHLSVAYLIENLGSIRAENFDNLENPGGGSVIAYLGSLLASGSMLSVIAAARFGRTGGWSLLAIGVINFFLIAAVGLFVYAGRTTLFYGIGLVLISFYVGGRRILVLSLKRVLLASLLLVGIWYFSVSWVQTREGSINPEATLINGQRANYRPWLAPIARKDDALGVGLVSLGYMASPLPTLAFYLQQRPTPGPFWGGYSFPLEKQAVQKLSGARAPRAWIETRHAVFAPLESAGYSGNVWATWLRDLLVDFGYLGAVVFCGLFGAFMAWARNGFERTGALYYHCFEVLACFTLAYGAFAGILFFTFLATAFLLAVVLMLAVRMTFSEGATARAQRRPKPHSEAPANVS